jgi:hypothetical protein
MSNAWSGSAIPSTPTRSTSIGLLRKLRNLPVSGHANQLSNGKSQPDRGTRRMDTLGAMADLEQGIIERESLKRGLSRWIVLHIGAALVMYPLLALHIWSGIYYGLRWL